MTTPNTGNHPDQSPRDINRELQSLHTLLSELQEVDNPLRNELIVIAQDIDRALQRRSQAENTSLQQRLREAIARFESSHPHVTQVVAGIADLLSGAGI